MLLYTIQKTVGMYYTKKFTIFFTLAAEFTKQFYIKTLLTIHVDKESEQIVLSQIEGLTIVVH